LVLGSGSWISGPPPSYCTFSLPYGATNTGLQNAINAIEACRTAGIAHSTAIGIILDVPPIVGNYVYSIGLTIPQTSSVTASGPLIVRSTYDSTIAALPEPVCAGGTQDNISEATNPGLNNPDCTGTNMYFQGTASSGPSNPCGANCPGGSVSGVLQNVVTAGITTVSVNTTTLQPITVGTQLVDLTNGYVSPTLVNGGVTTTASNNGCPTGQLAIDVGSVHGTFECVTPASSINVTGLYATFAYAHGTGATVSFTPNVSGTTGSFNLANGKATNVSAYNYLQYLPQIETSGATPAMTFCSGLPTDSNYCGTTGVGTGTATQIGPDHWEFEDLAFSLTPTNTNAETLIKTGDNTGQTAITQLATHIHFRRDWANGGWTSLATGYNPISNALSVSACIYCSIVGSQGSQLMRPLAEDHVVSANGQQVKIDNNWFEGASSCIFPGGNDTPVSIPGWISFTDVEMRRNRCTYPYTWLGGNMSGIILGTFGTGGTKTFAKNAIITQAVTGATAKVPFKTVNINQVPVITVVCGTACPDAVHAWTDTSGDTFTPVAIPTVPNLQWGTYAPYRKNCLEFKNAVRVVADGNIFENNDNTGGQNGTCWTGDTSNAGPGLGQGIENYSSVRSDDIFSNDIWRNACEFGDTRGRGPSDFAVVMGTTREQWLNNLWYGMSGTGPGCDGETFGLEVENGVGYHWNATLTENSAGTQATAVAFASIDFNASLASANAASGGSTVYNTTGSTAAINAILCGSPTSGYLFVTGFTNAGNNSPTPAGFLCTASSSSTLTLTNPNGVAETPANAYNAACVATASMSPACANPVLSGTSGANGNGSSTYGYKAIDLRTGEPVQILAGQYSGSTTTPVNCTSVGAGATFSSGTGTFQMAGYYFAGAVWPSTIGPLATSGSTPLYSVYNAGTSSFTYYGNGLSSPSPWSTANVSVTFPWAGASAGATDTSGTCVLGTQQGSPFNTTFNHITFITDAVDTLGYAPGDFIQNFAFTNSIMLSLYPNSGIGGIWNSAAPTGAPICNGFSSQEGTCTENFNFDLTSATFDYMVWPGRTNTLYTEYGNNTAYPDTALGACTPPACIATPPTSWAFPLTPCAVGFAYSCSGNVPLTLSDYHQFALSSGSTYHNAASDSLDVGAILTGTALSGSSVDYAQTLNLYVCGTSCGSPGPFPDQ
jgi:hypothetical protein